MSDTTGDIETSVADLARLDEGLIQALRACGSDEEMEEICGRMIVASPWVAIDPHAVSSLIPLLSDCQPISWSWLCDPRSITDTERFFDLALNASLNGGYFWSPSPGTVSQWQVQGSGSQALQDWLDLMRAQGLLPGHDRPGGSDWDNRIRASLIVQPYAS